MTETLQLEIIKQADWQPVEVAPEDQEVIVFAPHESPKVFTASFWFGCWVRTSSGEYAPRDEYYGDGDIQVTRWMHLPQDPET